MAKKNTSSFSSSVKNKTTSAEVIAEKIGKRLPQKHFHKIEKTKKHKATVKLEPPPRVPEKNTPPFTHTNKHSKTPVKLPRVYRIFFWIAILVMAAMVGALALLIWRPEYLFGTLQEQKTDTLSDQATDGQMTGDTLTDTTISTDATIQNIFLSTVVDNLPFDFKLPNTWHVYANPDYILPGSKKYGVFLQTDARAIVMDAAKKPIFKGQSIAKNTAITAAESRQADLKLRSDITQLKRSAVTLGNINAVRLSYSVTTTAETDSLRSYFEYYLDDKKHNLAYWITVQTAGAQYFAPFKQNLEFAALFEDTFKIL